MVLPEYGRNIQQMVDYCVGIKDREERTRCAYGIIAVMANLFPEFANDVDNDHKLWDHLNIMADFKLDIDFPCDVLRKENLNPRPQMIPYGASPIRYRHYGKNIEQMINRVASMENGPDKDVLISMIAHHMKKLMIVHNKEGVSDAKILKDLAEYSHGRITLDPATYLLHEFKEVTVQPQKQGKKKKK